MQAQVLEYFEGFTTEQLSKAGRFNPRSVKFSDASTTVKFCNIWLVEAD